MIPFVFRHQCVAVMLAMPYTCAWCSQDSTSAAVAASVIAFIEGDVFKGSRLMPLEDLLTALPGDVKTPGLPTAHSVAFRKALQKARDTLASVPVATGDSDNAPVVEAALPVSLPTGRMDPPPVPPVSNLVRVSLRNAT